jgi:hypothetical protein
MSPDEGSLDPWQALVEAINSQPEPIRQVSWNQLRVFVHDLRQSIGQVNSAEGILRRMLEAAPPGPELIEMLDIIQSATGMAAASLADFTTGFIERIEPELK